MDAGVISVTMIPHRRGHNVVPDSEIQGAVRTFNIAVLDMILSSAWSIYPHQRGLRGHLRNSRSATQLPPPSTTPPKGCVLRAR